MRTLSTQASLDAPQIYDGRQLAAHFLRSRFGLQGDAAAVWLGPARVEIAELVDLADRESGAFIAADEMVHLIIEAFEFPLVAMIGLQRVLAACVAQRVTQAVEPAVAATVRREGDDVYVGDGKLSVSIATASPVSSLIHFAINRKATGAPVSIACLDDLGLDAQSFAKGWLSDVEREWSELWIARTKVRAVSEWPG